MPNKFTLTLIISLFCLSFLTSQVRYQDPIFENVTVTEDVHYSTNISILPLLLGADNPEPVDLFMDIYAPEGDDLAERPVVIFAHRGDFLPAILNQSPYGTKRDSAVVEFCTQLARRGYVTAAIDYRLGWNPRGSDLDIKKTVLEAVYRITQDMRAAVRFMRLTAIENDNPFGIDTARIAIGGFDAAGYAANNVAYLKTYDQVLLPKFLDFSTDPPTPFIIPDFHGDPYGIEAGHLNVPNHVGYSSDVSAVINFEGGLGDFDWIEAGDPPSITFMPLGKFDNAGIRDVTIGVGGSIIIADGAFPDTIVAQSQALGNQDIFLNNIPADNDELTQKARTLSGGLEGIYLYSPDTMVGSVQCDPTAGAPAVGYGGNSYPWNWYNEAIFAQIWDMVPGQTIPSEIFICQYNTSEGNPNDPVISRTMIDTIVRYMTPRLMLAMNLGTTNITELDKAQVDFQVFPNPTSDIISVVANSQIMTTELMDMSGKVILVNREIGNQQQINVHQLSAGMYILRSRFSDGVIHHKIQVNN